jgi:hypothetical protein
MSAPLRPPCHHCPFRARYQGENDYLRPGRRLEIVRSVMEGASFPCHETVTHDDDGHYEHSAGEVDCVGLDIVMAREGLTGQMVRIRERIGMLDPERLLKRSKRVKLWTWDEIQDDGDEPPDENMDICVVSAPGCEAPAGWLIGGSVVNGTEFTDNVCDDCGDHVCENCMTSDEHDCWRYAIEDAKVIDDSNWFPPAQQRSPFGQRALPFNQPEPDVARRRAAGPPSDTLSSPTTRKGSR